MKVEHQNEEYEELDDEEVTDEEDVEEDDEDEDDENDNSPGNFLQSLPKQYMKYAGYIAAGVVGVVLIGFILFSGGKKQEAVDWDEEDTEEAEEYVEPEPEPVVEEEPVAEEEPVEETPSEVSEEATIDDEQAKLLRQYGYTGEEIDFYLSNGVNVDDLVAQSKKLQKEAIEEEMQQYQNTASQGYKDLMSNTYLGQPANEIPIIAQVDITDENKEEYQVTKETLTVNSDYSKMPLNGPELLLKCKLDTATYVWVSIDPVTWTALPERGNVNIEYDKYTVKDQVYISNAHVTEGNRTVEAD